jgi:hypothetical protein
MNWMELCFSFFQKVGPWEHISIIITIIIPYVFKIAYPVYYKAQPWFTLKQAERHLHYQWICNILWER